MQIVSVNIGQRKEVFWEDKKVVTGIFKDPVATSIFLNYEEVRGDEVSDRKYHGGINQAVYGYALKHYDFWKPKYPHLQWQNGMFGENLTIDALEEKNIHVGDTYEVGGAVLEATLPRTPCYKLGMRFNDMEIITQFWNTTKCGVYFKVVQTGLVHVGDKFRKIKSGSGNPTIADLFSLRKQQKGIL